WRSKQTRRRHWENRETTGSNTRGNTMERRAFFTALGTGVGAGLGLLTTNAMASKPVMGHFGGDSTEDDVAVANVVFSERWARDTGQFDLMTSFWNPNATVAVSWFKGTATDFITATEAH